MSIKLPTFEQSQQAVRLRKANPLEQYIYEYEAAGFINPQWRTQLQTMLNYISRKQKAKQKPHKHTRHTQIDIL